ncbi:spermidine/putrescine ABC transporter substrate-binding protein [Christensenellaceae bacterium OttesenSCG-928-M15]|nr:spermidine/putrescine ABC transporter substrate-binding protein [Christensenellaceae bacterium OttesenSCG-928-M15]
MKKLALFLAMVMALGGLMGCGGSSGADDTPTRTIDGVNRDYEGSTLSILNWGEFIDEDILVEFEKMTGITVKYYTTASNEEMLVKVGSPDSVIDICFPSDFTTERMVEMDLLAEIDHNNIPNLQYIDERFLNLSFDDGNRYSVPYMWGTVGIMYNTTLVDEPVTSWNILWDEKYADQIYMYDSVRDTMAVSLKRLGYSLNSTNEAEINEAMEELIKQKPIVKAYLDDPMKDRMVAGEGAFGVIYSGDAFWCIQENPDLAYAVPDEGSNIFCDAAVILKNTKNKAAAEMFLNFLCDPEISLKNTDYIGYSTPNKVAMQNVDPEWLEDETYNPPAEILDNCEVFHYLGDFTEVYGQAWSRVKSS